MTPDEEIKALHTMLSKAAFLVGFQYSTLQCIQNAGYGIVGLQTSLDTIESQINALFYPKGNIEE